MILKTSRRTIGLEQSEGEEEWLTRKSEKSRGQILVGRISGAVHVMQGHRVSNGAPFQNCINLKCLVFRENMF